MSRSGYVPGDPGPECICGAELREVPLPPDLAALSGRDKLLVHAESGDTRCYPDGPDRAGHGCYAEVLEG